LSPFISPIASNEEVQANGRHCMKLEIRITLNKNCSGLNPEAESSKLLAKEIMH
jgi:hypothetical protein